MLYGIEQWGVDAANAYHVALFNHFERLAERPFLSEVREDYRRSVCGSDSVYYRIDEETIEIMAIIGQQNVDDWI